MKRIFLLLAFTLSISCEHMPLSNLCADRRSMEEVRLHTAMHVWAMENPGEALLTAFFAGFSAITGGAEKLEGELAGKIRPIAENLKLEDVSKPKKISEDQYKCSAVFSYRGKRLAVSYNLNLIHSGREKVYAVEVQDVAQVR